MKTITILLTEDSVNILNRKGEKTYTYLIAKNGLNRNGKKPQLVEEREFKNIIAANRYCKKLGKEYWAELKNDFSIMLSNGKYDALT